MEKRTCGVKLRREGREREKNARSDRVLCIINDILRSNAEMEKVMQVVIAVSVYCLILFSCNMIIFFVHRFKHGLDTATRKQTSFFCSHTITRASPQMITFSTIAPNTRALLFPPQTHICSTSFIRKRGKNQREGKKLHFSPVPLLLSLF